jgi:hypothetical protein
MALLENEEARPDRYTANSIDIFAQDTSHAIGKTPKLKYRAKRILLLCTP